MAGIFEQNSLRSELFQRDMAVDRFHIGFVILQLVGEGVSDGNPVTGRRRMGRVHRFDHHITGLVFGKFLGEIDVVFKEPNFAGEQFVLIGGDAEAGEGVQAAGEQRDNGDGQGLFGMRDDPEDRDQ